MSIKLFSQNLAVSGSEERLPLSSLDLDENSHVHGVLRFQVAGMFVPHMGYFGPDDICFNTWLIEFENIIRAFEVAQDATYIFDEGEQGQPAYHFEKRGASVYLSIVDAEFSGGEADPAWQSVEFDYQEFVDEHTRFKEAFLGEVKRAAPGVSKEWVNRLLTRVV